MNGYLPKQLVDDFVQQFSGSAKDINRQYMRRVLESQLRKLNLVTREEFDAQAAVLARTRKRLQDLEMQIADMEDTINNYTEDGSGVEPLQHSK